MSKVIKQVGSFLQKDVLDPHRGKYSVPDGYKVNEKAYQDTADQAAFSNALRDQALTQRQGPSLAEQQLQQGLGRTQGQLAGRAAANRGPNQATSMREGLRAQTEAGQEGAAQTQMLQAQESQQDYANQQAAQGAYAQDLARQQTTRMAMEESKTAIEKQRQQLQTQQNLNRQQESKESMQTGMKVAASMFGSDEKLKKDIKSTDLDEMAEKLKAVDFKYKQPNGESYQDGTVTGILAQDLEKSKLGKSMVHDGPDGKKLVDLKKAIPVTVAAVSDIVKRIKKLEKKA